MERKIDIHMHSIYSDGEYSPQELVQMAKDRKLEVISITDHDTILGTKQVLERKDIEIISGVELTARTAIGREHILGYDFDVEDATLNHTLEEKKKIDIQNFFISYECLKKTFSITFPEEDINSVVSKLGNVGRVDLSNLLKKYGYAKTTDEAFQKYLNPVYELTRQVKKGLTEEECIHLLKSAKALVSIAHPITLNPRYKEDLNFAYHDLKKRLIQMKAMGLDAIEINHIHQDSAFREMLKSLAHELSLLESGGTDFHGPNVKPDVELGSGIHGNIAIKKLSLVDEIHKRKGQI